MVARHPFPAVFLTLVLFCEAYLVGIRATAYSVDFGIRFRDEGVDSVLSDPSIRKIAGAPRNTAVLPGEPGVPGVRGAVR